MADAIVDTGSNSNGTNTVPSTSPLPPTPAILNGDDGLMPAVAASRQVAPSDNVTYPDSALGDLAARSGFLCFFIVVGFLGNCLLLTTLIRSSRLRRKVIYLFVVYLAVINVVECLVNLPVVLGATVAEQWAYGDDVCRLNAFSIQLTSQALLLGLCMMACDRMLAVTNPVAYPSRLSISKAAILIVVCVCASCGLTVPILTPTIPVQPFAARYLCSVGSQAPFLYVILTSALGYMLPLLVILGTYVAVARVAIRSKLQQRNANPSQVYSNVGAAAEQQLWREISAAKYVLLLFVLWCMFQGPYMLLSFTEEFRNSDGIRISQAALEFTFPWEMSLAFTWMKFSYVTFLPVATFCCRKEVWQKFKNILLCRKSNLVNDASPHDTPTSPRKTDSVDRKKVDSLGKVPVLFATENGLHFQTYSKSPTHEVSESQMYASDLTGTLTKSAIVTARKCDVAGSQLLQQGDQVTDVHSFIHSFIHYSIIHSFVRSFFHSFIYSSIHWKSRVVMMPTLSSLMASQVVFKITCVDASDDNVRLLQAIYFQCSTNQQIIWPVSQSVSQSVNQQDSYLYVYICSRIQYTIYIIVFKVYTFMTSPFSEEPLS